MNGPRLLAEFFSDGLCLLLSFLTHPVTFGVCALGFVTFGLTYLFEKLSMKSIAHSDAWEIASAVIFLFGLFLVFAFIVWASDFSEILGGICVESVVS